MIQPARPVPWSCGGQPHTWKTNRLIEGWVICTKCNSTAKGATNATTYTQKPKR